MSQRQHVSQAQAKRFQAQQELAPAQRMKLLCEASELYLKACDGLEDPVFIQALAMLANDALTEANQLKIMLSKGPIDKREEKPTTLNQKHQDFQWTMQANRMIAAVHTKRIQGLSEVLSVGKTTRTL